MTLPNPTFPPLLNGHFLAGSEDAFAQACERAASGELGAGDVLWSSSPSKVDMAIVLEPEVPLATAVQMLPLAMVAIGDCLGALTPPQVGVSFTWPNHIRVNGGLAGAVKAAASGKPELDSTPDWMVIGLELRHRREAHEPEPGEVPEQTWLSEEGCEELSPTDIIESYSRHFLTWLNDWNDDGFRSAHASWLFRAEERDQDISVTVGGKTFKGQMLGLDDNGNLLVKEGDETRSAMLIDVFVFPQV